ncbi:MAG: tRNA (N(6)-L-threonylcarbamoyladenosine(37)-C(2))-methylthiotransferase MtaB [Nitrospira sp.]|nr:tRNA (N(6)-L-threonylcarbamoyladenosine(37)-C(2))-methylthiotransferase MtaB [bacterium]MBL7050168.1 tRNA (N(6)-L-threonylcarbamoyladenosine(37)-C(2))-methylthiotransferase MtaB [Nitrospira sp.]
MRKVNIKTLGCKVNQSESASLEAILKDNNYEIVDNESEADICVVNTCTVTAKSDYQSRQFIRRSARAGAKVIATGCYAQTRPEELSVLEGIELVVGNSEKDSLLSHINNLARDVTVASSDGEIEKGKLSQKPYHSGRSRAFLKLQDGCDFSCSYCTVPKARGSSRSLPAVEVMDAFENLQRDGYREVVITGIHIGSYGKDLIPEVSLIDIVKEAALRFPDIRIRLSSIEPQEFDDEFLSLIQQGRVCPHLHIPLQSGSDRILRLMNRGYNTYEYKQLINKIITVCPDISIGTDLITGFPGESEQDFTDTVNYLRQIPFTYFHVFPYSKRPDTAAENMDGQISGTLKKERVKKLRHISDEFKKIYILKQLGRQLNVIVEYNNDNNMYNNALSENYLKISLKSKGLKPGKLVPVMIKSITDTMIIGEPL